MKRAVIYARVSTEEQIGNYSIPAQIEGAREYARKNEMEVVGVFSEDASGLKYPRPKLEDALEMIEQAQADVLICHADDRLNRHEVYGFLIRKRLNDAGAELHYTLTGPFSLGDDNRLLAVIQDAIASAEVRRITERMGRGKRQKAKGGAWIGAGKPPYGYRVVGEGSAMRLEVIEEHARVIRQIFEWYVHEKISTEAIVKRLRAMGVERPNFKTKAIAKNNAAYRSEWTRGTIYRILKNETYTGTFYAYRWKVIKGKGKIERPRDEWIEIPVPIIVDEETFAAAALRLDGSRNDTFRKRRYEYLMAGRLVCSLCSYNLTTFPSEKGKYIYYRCCSYRQRELGEKCSLPLFRVDMVDGVIWEHIKKMMKDPSGFRAAIDETREQARQDHSQLYADIESIEAEIKRQEGRLAQAITLYLDNDSDEKRFVREAAKRNQDEINGILRNLHQERDDLSRKVAQVSVSADTLKAVEAYAHELRDDLDYLTLDEQRTVVDALGASALLAYEDGHRVAYLTVLLRETRIDFENDSMAYLKHKQNIKPHSFIPLTFRLVLAA